MPVQSLRHVPNRLAMMSLSELSLLYLFFICDFSKAWTPSSTMTARTTNHQAMRSRGPTLMLQPIFRCVSLPCTCLSSVSETNAAKDSETTLATTETFTSPVTRVYIEDTDAYGMKYNANYLRSYERALHAAEVGSDSILAKHPDWTLVKVTQQKFKSTTPLGGNFVISGILVERYADSEVWDLCMSCPETNMVYNSATVTVGLPLSYSAVEPAELNDIDESNVVTTSIHHDVLHRDEFDPHHPNQLPLRSVLNLCERSRSNYIGGPDALSRMQNEDNTVVVVTSIDDLCSFQQHSYPRQRVRVKTDLVPKRKGLLCEARHYLFDDETDEPIAKAFVTMVALNATTKRPTAWPLWQ